jgi:hypothetical protein
MTLTICTVILSPFPATDEVLEGFHLRTTESRSVQPSHDGVIQHRGQAFDEVNERSIHIKIRP